MWTQEDNLTLLENLIVRSIFRDGVFMWYEIYPVEGYVLRITSLDRTFIDDDGNEIFDSYRTWGGATVRDANYDWEENPRGYMAELYDESMGEIAENEPEHEVI